MTGAGTGTGIGTGTGVIVLTYDIFIHRTRMAERLRRWT